MRRLLPIETPLSLSSAEEGEDMVMTVERELEAVQELAPALKALPRARPLADAGTVEGMNALVEEHKILHRSKRQSAGGEGQNEHEASRCLGVQTAPLQGGHPIGRISCVRQDLFGSAANRVKFCSGAVYAPRLTGAKALKAQASTFSPGMRRQTATAFVFIRRLEQFLIIV
jgi:hypothetical protein